MMIRTMTKIRFLALFEFDLDLGRFIAVIMSFFHSSQSFAQMRGVVTGTRDMSGGGER